jgi:hypothetical protein
MKKLLGLLLVLCLAFPLVADAAKKPAQMAKAPLTAEEKAAFDAKSDVILGNEVVYTNKDLTQASFNKDKVTNVKHNLYYVCLCRKVYKRRPGTCPCGKAMGAAFKAKNEWYALKRNEQGTLQILPGSEACGGCPSQKSEVKDCGGCPSHAKAKVACCGTCGKDKAKLDRGCCGCGKGKKHDKKAKKEAKMGKGCATCPGH